MVPQMMFILILGYLNAVSYLNQYTPADALFRSNSCSHQCHGRLINELNSRRRSITYLVVLESYSTSEATNVRTTRGRT